MSASATKIPYERQEDSRKCGAAALCMVYGSFGQKVKQADVWPRISTDQWSARSHLLAKDALSRGYAAVTLQASRPDVALARCCNDGIPAILNHRLHPSSRQGHYSVLVGQSRSGVLLHDPYHGPARMLSHQQFGQLWNWEIGGREVAGNILVAVAPAPQSSAPCPACGTSMPQSVDCPDCGEIIPLPIPSVLGCANAQCPERSWLRLFCPQCDRHLTSLAGEPLKTSAATPKTLVSVLIDLVKERVDMAAGRTSDPQMQSQLRMTSQYITDSRGEIESEFKTIANDLKGVQAELDNVDQAAQTAADEAMKKKEQRKQAVAAKKAENKKQRAAAKAAANARIPELDGPEPVSRTLDSEQLRRDVIAFSDAHGDRPQ